MNRVLKDPSRDKSDDLALEVLWRTERPKLIDNLYRTVFLFVSFSFVLFAADCLANGQVKLGIQLLREKPHT